MTDRPAPQPRKLADVARAIALLRMVESGVLSHTDDPQVEEWQRTQHQMIMGRVADALEWASGIASDDGQTQAAFTGYLFQADQTRRKLGLPLTFLTYAEPDPQLADLARRLELEGVEPEKLASILDKLLCDDEITEAEREAGFAALAPLGWKPSANNGA